MKLIVIYSLANVQAAFLEFCDFTQGLHLKTRK